MTTPTKRTIAIAALLATLAGGTVAAAASSAITREVAGDDVNVSGCVIRFSNPDGTPSIHANGAHRCAGVESVDITKHGDIRVTQSIKDPAAYPILFAMCQADETLGGRRGIICGASGGTGETRFSLYDTDLGRQLDLTKPADRARVQGKNANLWIGFVHAEAAR